MEEETIVEKGYNSGEKWHYWMKEVIVEEGGNAKRR